MPAAATTHAHGPSAALSRRDPGYAALKRALRVTIASCIGFYVCRYLIDDPTLAVYALFAAIAAGALSEVVGTPAQRVRGYAAVLVAGLVLVTIGTLLAGSTAAATAGMLVVGFVIAYAAVAGPRVGSVANGLQLFYVLPCFPPYAPDELGDRLLGVVIGIVLLAIADRVLWPLPGPAELAPRVATAAERTARYATALAAALRSAGTTDRAALDAARVSAAEAADALRLSLIPVPERPLGFGLHDRSLLATSSTVRLTVARLTGMWHLQARPDRHPAHPATAELVETAGSAMTEVAATLRGDAGPPSVDTLDATLQAYLDRRAELLPGGPSPTKDLRAGLSAASIAEMARRSALAVEGAVRPRGAAPPREARDLPPELWFLAATRIELLWRRLRDHFTPRSVLLQNAVRIAIGLAVARIVAGELDLSHGFWVLLATLSLMRTSAVAGRAVMLRAFLGTIVGAVVAGCVLLLVGSATEIYAWTLPAVMVVAFAAGPLLGVAAGQAGFTVVVAVLFAQVAPATWQLAEVRLVDVVIGGVVGAVIGAAIWPRGGGGEIRRIAAESLRACADEVTATVGLLSGVAPPAGPEVLSKVSSMFDQTYIQFRTEPTGPGPHVDWLTVVATVRRLHSYSATLRVRHPDPGPLPWPDAGEPLRAAAADVTSCLRVVADAVAAGRPVPSGTAAGCRARFAVRTPDGLAAAPDEALRLLDGWGWLDGLVDDVGRLEEALTVAPAPDAQGTSPGHATQERSAVNPTDIEAS